MIMMQDGVEVMILPDDACCTMDEHYRSPLDLEQCPLLLETCTGECVYYSEEVARPECRARMDGKEENRDE